MKSTAKAEALLRDVADKLKVRYAGSVTINTVRAAKDANGWPMLFLSIGGSEAEAAPVIGIRVMNIDAVSKDIFGNATNAYAPHILELAYELAAANKPEPSLNDLAIAKYEACATGCRYQEKQIANGTAVTETSMNAAVAATDLDALYWPTKSV